MARLSSAAANVIEKNHRFMVLIATGVGGDELGAPV